MKTRIYEDWLPVVVLLVVLMVLLQILGEVLRNKRYEEVCVNGIAYFVGRGGVPASVVVDNSTLRPKLCPLQEVEHEQ